MSQAHQISDLRRHDPRELRALIRTGAYAGPTAGLASGFAQANLVMLPSDEAEEFLGFCELNPAPCPLIERTRAGQFEPKCAAGADLRTDLPRYRVYRDGELAEGSTSVNPGPDVVSFLLGCSFTFEAELQRAGIPVRHIEQGSNVPMYRTNIDCRPCGEFKGKMVVSMRPMTWTQARQAGEITSRLPQAHGSPVQMGDPASIGIVNLDRPDYGDPVEIRLDEVPVFWACGVTPLEAILQAKPKWAVVHEPGHMFITDLRA